MKREEIAEVFARLWRPNWASIDVDEALFLNSLIERLKPQTFIEIGMASGISAGLIARFLEENGGKKIVSLDHNNKFFGDQTKQNGFLVREVYRSDKVAVDLRHFKTSLDIPDFGEAYEMAFVDANHQHPWPTIDTLCLYPFMTGAKWVAHHDLRLFRKQDIAIGIGPKYLFDQFPESHRNKSSANDGNIFALRLDIPKAQLEEIAADAFALPWSLRAPIPPDKIAVFSRILDRYYGKSLRQHFLARAQKSNVKPDEPPSP